MRVKADSELVRRQNRRLVLDVLRRKGPMARVELGRLTGLSPATITSIAGQLIEDGIILELEDSTGEAGRARRGRPLTSLDLNPQAARIVAAKVSIGLIELALADNRGEILDRHLVSASTHETAADAFGSLVASEVRDFLMRSGVQSDNAMRVVVAVQGATDSRSGTIMWSPAFGARDVAIAGPVEARLGIPCIVANDANMMVEALDSDVYGASVAAVFMGYGIGMGLIVDGKVYHGPTGAAAEFGHMNHVPNGALCRCGRRGCIEAYAADYAIARHARGEPPRLEPLRSGISPEAMAEIVARARSGDLRARAAFRAAGEALGYGLARLTALLSPRRIVIAGPGTGATDLVEPYIRQAFAEGLVEELRRDVEIEIMPIETDMIIKGAITSSLRDLDSEVFSVGMPDRASGVARRTA